MNPEKPIYSQLSFEYRTQHVSIPFCTTWNEFGKLATSRILPALRIVELTQTNQPKNESGLALMEYSFEGDRFAEQHPQAAEALKQMLLRAGFDLSNGPKKLDPIRPTRQHLLTAMSTSQSEYYYMNEDLVGQVFIFGPIIATEAKTDIEPPFFDYTAEVEATSAWIPGCVAVDGRMIYQKLHKSGGDRVYLEDVARLFHLMIPSPV
jgi:hypothetical protein